MSIYTLKTPFDSRVDGQTIKVTELLVPELITVGMMRKVQQGSVLGAAHDLTNACAGLNVFDASKVTTPDALGYVEDLSDLLQPFEVASFEVPEIKPIQALVKKITVDATQPIEFCAQVLQHHGFKKTEIDAMDLRGFMPAIEEIMRSFFDPKT